MAQTTMQRLNAERKTLGLEGIVVFNALMSRLDFENYIQVSQTEIADELEMQRSNVSRAVKRLVDLGFIRLGPKVGKSYTYQLHPELAWKGRARTISKLVKPQGRRAGRSSTAGSSRNWTCKTPINAGSVPFNGDYTAPTLAAGLVAVKQAEDEGRDGRGIGGD